MAPGSGFRQSMAWLHTWAGVLLGGLLLAIFWTGSLSVFDREIDRWMQPDTRLPPPPSVLSLDQLVVPHARQLAQDAPVWSITLPTSRAPTIQLDYQRPDLHAVRRHIDPHTGALLVDHNSWGGTRFIFPFHFSLHLGWQSIGYWLVGAAGMGMLVLLISGVVAHRKLIAAFFTFRPHKRLQRSLLDLHNLTGVLVLPFHFVISLSGLIIFFAVYFPGVTQALYPQDGAQFQLEALGNFSRPASGMKADSASLDAIVLSARETWESSGKPGQAYLVRVWHPGDHNAYVEVRRSHAQEVTRNADRLMFDGTTGGLLHQHSAATVAGVNRFMAGLHFIQFNHWTLRWLYFIGGLSGCVLIGTGLLFWSGSRRARHERQGRIGARLVDALCVATATGLVIATLVFFVANRLLPYDSQWIGQPREALEGWAFYLSWLLTLIHASAYPKNAWCRQLQFAAALAVSAVVLNALTTRDALPLSLFSGSAAVAGMDLLLLILAGLCLLASQRIRLDQVTPAPDRRLARKELPGG